MTTITATLDSGTLTIQGDEGNDRIFVTRVGAKIAASVQSNAASRRPLGNWAAASVKAITVGLGTGANFYDGHNAKVPYTLSSGIFDADSPAPGGMKVEDVISGDNEVAGHEAALAGFIHAAGKPPITYDHPTATGAAYRVKIGDRSDVVEFNGTLSAEDTRSKRPGVFWSTLEHRAFRLHFSVIAHAVVAIADIRGGYPMSQLDVRNLIPSMLPAEFASNRPFIFNAIRDGLASGKMVVADTAYPASPQAPPLGREYPPYRVLGPFRGTHQYTILAANPGGTLTVRDPKGVNTAGKGNGIETFDLETCLRAFQDVRIG